MPTFKHPCPHCGKFINRDVVMCPYCGTRDPFAPARCANCNTVIEDPSWVACPRCGQPVGAAAVAQQAAQQKPTGNQPPPSTFLQQTPTSIPTASPTPQPGPPPATPTIAPAQATTPVAKCSGCGAPLAAGARFCTVCGTLAA